MLLNDRVNLVLDGSIKQVAWTYRPGVWATVSMFFERHQITIRKFGFVLTRSGKGEYIDTNVKYIISFDPLLRVRHFISGGKGDPHSEIREYTYNSHWLSYNLGPDNLGEAGNIMIKKYLTHYGHRDNSLYNAIIPWDMDINPLEEYKRLWRHHDMRFILKGLNMPTSKAMVRTMLSVIYDENNKNKELPLLQSAKFVWRLCEDVNTFIEVFPVLNQNFPLFWDLGEAKKGFWKMIKKWKRKPRTLFTKSMKNITRATSNYWGDSLSMVNQIYNAIDVVDVRGTTVKMLHDNLSIEVRKVELIRGKMDIPYEDELLCIHGMEIEVEDPKQTIRLILPKTGNDIAEWSVKLRNCMHSYADRVVDRDTTLIGVIDSNNKLIIAIEWHKQRIRQMSAHGNTSVDSGIKRAIKKCLRENLLLPEPGEKLNDEVDEALPF